MAIEDTGVSGAAISSAGLSGSGISGAGLSGGTSSSGAAILTEASNFITTETGLRLRTE